MKTAFELMLATMLTALSIAAVPFAIAYAMMPESRRSPRRLPAPKN